jgi:hypothetical protein
MLSDLKKQFVCGGGQDQTEEVGEGKKKEQRYSGDWSLCSEGEIKGNQ